MTTLREAAEALLAQWDSPDQGPCHLAPRIAQLRAALAAPPPGLAEIERLLDEAKDAFARYLIDTDYPDKQKATKSGAASAALLTAIADALAQARLSGVGAAALVCPICDGGPGNNCACTCPDGAAQ